MNDSISVAITLYDELVSEIVNDSLPKDPLKIVSFDYINRGLITFQKCHSSPQMVSSLKRPPSKTFLGVQPKQVIKRPKPSPKPEPVANNEISDYAVLSAASSKVDTSTLISVVQNLRTNEKEYRCSFCEYKSNSQRNAKRHVEMKHVDTGVLFRCKMCSTTSKLKATLKSHYMKVHQMPDTAAKAMVEESNP